jgi:hypothetical protein
MMTKKIFIVSAAFLALSGVTLAQQSGEEKKSASKQGMMKEMMKQKPSGESGMEGMGGMMGMMKMMEQCSKMMESGHQHGEASKGNHKQ